MYTVAQMIDKSQHMYFSIMSPLKEIGFLEFPYIFFLFFF